MQKRGGGVWVNCYLQKRKGWAGPEFVESRGLHGCVAGLVVAAAGGKALTRPPLSAASCSSGLAARRPLRS